MNAAVGCKHFLATRKLVYTAKDAGLRSGRWGDRMAELGLSIAVYGDLFAGRGALRVCGQ